MKKRVLAGQRVTLRLKLKRKALRAVRRDLAVKKQLKTRVTVTATDLAGNTANTVVRPRLKR